MSGRPMSRMTHSMPGASSAISRPVRPSVASSTTCRSSSSRRLRSRDEARVVLDDEQVHAVSLPVGSGQCVTVTSDGRGRGDARVRCRAGAGPWPLLGPPCRGRRPADLDRDVVADRDVGRAGGRGLVVGRRAVELDVDLAPVGRLDVRLSRADRGDRAVDRQAATGAERRRRGRPAPSGSKLPSGRSRCRRRRNVPPPWRPRPARCRRPADGEGDAADGDDRARQEQGDVERAGSATSASRRDRLDRCDRASMPRLRGAGPAGARPVAGVAARCRWSARWSSEVSPSTRSEGRRWGRGGPPGGPARRRTRRRPRG